MRTILTVPLALASLVLGSAPWIKTPPAMGQDAVAVRESEPAPVILRYDLAIALQP